MQGSRPVVGRLTARGPRDPPETARRNTKRRQEARRTMAFTSILKNPSARRWLAIAAAAFALYCLLGFFCCPGPRSTF